MNSGNPTMFQSTHSLRSATFSARYFFHSVLVSIHALLAECDPDLAPAGQKRRGFNPRTPCGVRLETVKSNNTVLAVSIHALLAECDVETASLLVARRVSIHALLAECDPRLSSRENDFSSFNPRTPCGVRRRLPQRGPVPPGFNPRTPCGVRPVKH